MNCVLMNQFAELVEKGFVHDFHDFHIWWPMPDKCAIGATQGNSTRITRLGEGACAEYAIEKATEYLEAI